MGGLLRPGPPRCLRPSGAPLRRARRGADGGAGVALLSGRMPDIVPAPEVLRRLREGNERYVANVRSLDSLMSYMRRAELSAGQAPVAVILGCSDSRVPAEVVFDQGLGDLFVIRVAGNIVAPSQIGSVEFAAWRFGTRLVVVVGHTQCGAVAATLEELQGRSTTQSRNLR